ncbi:MAG: glycosyltransferase family 2 protein [Solirubrobacteraceae bacterium]
MTDPALHIVVVSYRCRALLEDCLCSLERHPYTGGPTEVTVVDNGSRDGTAEFIRTRFPAVRLVELPDNRGFASANNVALRATRAERVLLLNPDTQVWPGVLDRMAAFLDAHPRAGIVGCRLVRRDGTFDHAAKRSFPSVVNALRYFGPSSSNGYLAPHVPEDSVGGVDAVSGAFMLVRREALEKVGLLDERFWMYAEDLDWCYRAKQAGWEVLYNGSVTTLHIKSGVVGHPRRLRQNWAFHSTMAQYYRKHHAGRNALLDGLVYAGIGVKFGASVVRSRLTRPRR